MRFFKKKTKNVIDIYSPTLGSSCVLSTLEDPVFSSGMMGQGFYIKPQEGNIYSPVDGVVKSIFPIKHAIVIQTSEGIDILLHLGVDTVELKGEGFDVKVKEGQSLKQGDMVCNMNLETLSKAKKNTAVIVIFPELNTEQYSLSVIEETVEKNQVAARLMKK